MSGAQASQEHGAEEHRPGAGTEGAPDVLATFRPGLFGGQVVVVTGGGRGIGRLTAHFFAHLGADLVIAARNEVNLRRTHDEIVAMGRECLSMPLNIRDIASVEAMVAATIERYGAVDHLVNNAGGQFPARPSQISDGGWRAVVDLNLNGTWNVCSRFVPHMIEAGRGGSIVNIVHNQVFDRGAVLFAHSGAARAGVVNLSHTMALFLAPHGITVNAVAPGAISTEGFWEEELPNISDDIAAYQAQVRADIPAGRFATPDEIAAGIAFLCSPAGRYVTGQCITIDGGHGMGNQRAVYNPATIAW